MKWKTICTVKAPCNLLGHMFLPSYQRQPRSSTCLSFPWVFSISIFEKEKRLSKGGCKWCGLEEKGLKIRGQSFKSLSSWWTVWPWDKATLLSFLVCKLGNWVSWSFCALACWLNQKPLLLRSDLQISSVVGGDVLSIHRQHLLPLSLFFRAGCKLPPEQIGSAGSFSCTYRVGGPPAGTVDSGPYFLFVWIWVFYSLNMLQ